MIRFHRLLCLALICTLGACKKKDDKNSDPAAAGDPAGETEDKDGDGQPDGPTGPGEGQVTLAGSLAIGLLRLQDKTPTHVIAMEPESNSFATAEVNEDGTFELYIDKELNWVVTFVDSTGTGSDMLVSRFGSGELDTIATNSETTDVDLGELDTTAEKAGGTIPQGDLLTSLAMSEEASVQYGAVDDVSLRYVNPDIDGDGQIDAVAGQKLTLDFHNRFNFKKNGADLAMKDIKNAFPPENASLEFSGSGVMPWFEDSVYNEPVSAYTWKFSADVSLGTNGGVLCDGYTSGQLLPANTACNMEIVAGASNNIPSIELTAAVDGTYELTAGGKTFTWTNVKVSDFSAGTGFIALFVRMDVNNDNKLTGISYKWQRKNGDGTYSLATAEELKLLVSSGGGYVSLKVDGANSGKELGVKLPLEPEGAMTFADAEYGEAVHLPDGVTEAEVKAGLAWSRVLENPGISYDDKLGMRFFFGFNGNNGGGGN